MRILMANNYHYLRGGSEKVMFEEMAGLSALGHDVACFSARHSSNVESPIAEAFPEVPEFGRLSAVGKAVHFWRIVANKHVKRAFASVLESWRPDVVHCHNVYGRLTPVVIEAAREREIPTVMTAHDSKLICSSYLRLDEGVPCSACSYGSYWPAMTRRCHKQSRLYSFLYAIESFANTRRYDGVSAFLCPSEFLLESFASKGLPRERLRLVRNFVEVASEGGEGKGNYVMFAGRLSPEKGIGTLLRAVEGLEVPLIIAGDGPQAGELRQEVEERGLAPRVRFTGHCDVKTTQRLMGGAGAVVVPSECFENAPMAVLEALAAGTPVIASEVGGIPEMVAPGETGVLFKPGDADSLRRAIVDVMAFPERRARMGEAARRVMKERFSREAHVRALLEAYAEAGA